MQPLKMTPIYKEMVWGGRRMAELLGKSLPPSGPIGESWELADHRQGRTVVAEGPLAGKTLRALLETHGADVLGQEEFARGGAVRFSLLVKFIDAADRLSVQVHPDDDYAARHHDGESGKTECWTVIHADPDAWVIHGLRAGVTRPALEKALKAGAVDDVLLRRGVKTGDFIWVPAGTVHAIGPGIVLAEVQQNSNVTYRLHDWGRAGLDGKPRELHVGHALACTRFEGDVIHSGGLGRRVDETGLVVDHLADCYAFSLSRVRLDRRPWGTDLGQAYAIIVTLAGRARLESGGATMPLAAGDTVLVPAAAGEYALWDAAGLDVLVVAPPGRAPKA